MAATRGLEREVKIPSTAARTGDARVESICQAELESSDQAEAGAHALPELVDVDLAANERVLVSPGRIPCYKILPIRNCAARQRSRARVAQLRHRLTSVLPPGVAVSGS